MLYSEAVLLYSEWGLPLQTLIAAEMVTKPAFQWENQKGPIAEKVQEDQCSQLKRS